MPDDVLKTVLPNGLTVIIKEMHHAPVASLWVWYRVGSRNEVPGLTGASHWVEHMMFKGTPRFPKGMIDRLVAREGGRFNAFTWVDFTAYFHSMPAERIELSLEIEADRMHNSSFVAEEVDSERTVIIAERQGHENDPMFLLGEEVQAAAFRVHSYHHEVIGDMADLHGMTRDDLYEHYRRFYHPGNAIVVVAGDFARDVLLARVTELFGAIPAGPAVPSVTRHEPEQMGERRVTVRGEEDTVYVQYAYRAPAARDTDFFPLAVLDTILGGASSFAVFGGGTTNRSSRLYRALVSGELAAAINAGFMPTLDPFLYLITAIVLSGRTEQEVEQAIARELKRLTDEPVSADELTRAIKQAKAQFAYSTESVGDQAFWYGYSELLGEHTWFDHYLAGLESVKADDVLRVARRVFGADKRVVGVYLPRALEAEPERARKRPAARKAGAKRPAAKKAAVKKAAVKKAAVKKAAVKKPAAKKTVVKKTVVKKPAVKKPAVKKPAAKRPVKKSPIRKTTTKPAARPARRRASR